MSESMENRKSETVRKVESILENHPSAYIHSWVVGGWDNIRETADTIEYEEQPTIGIVDLYDHLSDEMKAQVAEAPWIKRYKNDKDYRNYVPARTKSKKY